MNYRVLSIEEAIPLLLNKQVSSVVALDTEFNPETGALHGLSMAGGNPHYGFFGCFWSFQEEYQQTPYDTWFKQVLLPVTTDPTRAMVFHPQNVDLKKLRCRGLTDALTRCQLEDTKAMAYVYDDNLPAGLKDLAYCLLLQTKATSYAATQREINNIRKQAKGVIKEHLDNIW